MLSSSPSELQQSAMTIPNMVRTTQTIHNSPKQSEMSTPKSYTRPTPIRIPDSRQSNISQSTPSPRAALVAELRSATDRRKRDAGVNSPPGSPGLNNLRATTPLSSASSSHGGNSAGSETARVYAALYAKQQELLATSMLISQQQQRIQDAMNSAVYGEDYSGSPHGLYGSSPQQLANYQYQQQLLQQQQHIQQLQQLQQQYNSVLTSSPYAAANPQFQSSPSFLQHHYNNNHNHNNNNNNNNHHHHYHHHSSSSTGLGNVNYALPSDLTPPQTFYSHNRPSSPSLPQRPSSSTALRGSFLFSDPVSASSSPGSSPQPSNATPFRRGHRKASSLSSYTSNTNNSSSSSVSFGPIGNNGRPAGVGGIQTGNKKDGYYIPVRQPYAPPPLEELRKDRSKNFSVGHLL